MYLTQNEIVFYKVLETVFHLKIMSLKLITNQEGTGPWYIFLKIFKSSIENPQLWNNI